MINISDAELAIGSVGNPGFGIDMSISVPLWQSDEEIPQAFQLYVR